MSSSNQRWIDQTRNKLAFFLVGAFVGSIIALTFHAIPADNRDLLNYMLGQLSALAALALGYYFTKGAGQDAQDAARTENTKAALDTIKSVAGAGSDAAGAAAEQVAGAASSEADKITGKDDGKN